jgi:hypothetical protein
MASLEQPETHTTKWQYFHLGASCRDLGKKRQHVLSVEKNSFSRPKLVPYLIFSSLGNHRFFLGPLISSRPSRSSGVITKDEDESFPISDSPIQRWMNQSYGYSFQQNCLPPTHLYELLSMIDHMLIYVHDYYVLDLSLLYYIIKHRGKYLDEMISWLQWLYNFT